jgi:HAD superfamily hydrolase (TIGR01662 family)
MTHKLICFDIDGTLTDRDDIVLYPEVKTYFEDNFTEGDYPRKNTPTIALVTNQGGPACREAGWPWSNNFPSLDVVNRRLEMVVKEVSWAALHSPLIYVAYAFRLKDGRVIYPVGIKEHLKDENLRKPCPGMILRAMSFKRIKNPADVLMVGDRPEDQQAAEAAGVAFSWNFDFFGKMTKVAKA